MNHNNPLTGKMADEAYVKRVISFFAKLLDAYKAEIDAKYPEHRQIFDFYHDKFIFIFYPDKLVVKRNYYTNKKYDVVMNPNQSICVDEYKSLVYSNQTLRNILGKNPEDIGREIVRDEYLSNQNQPNWNDEVTDKMIEAHYQEEYDEKKQISGKHAELLSKINAVIKKTCDDKAYEIAELADYYSFFVDLKLPKSMSCSWFITSMYVPECISVFMDLLTIGNYRAAYLPLRQIFEAFLRALYHDSRGDDVRVMMSWLERNERDTYPMTGPNSVINSLTHNPRVNNCGTNVQGELRKIWKELCFKVHKQEFDVLLFYEFKKQKFDDLLKIFCDMIELLIITCVFNFPETYRILNCQIRTNRDKVEYCLLTS